VPYLDKLGISDLYASPITKARTGSVYGYDVTDPTVINPELGTESDFENLVRELKLNSMGLLLDIVPNHMAISSENPWWMDFLENGLSSPYASFFDVQFNGADGELRNKVVLPILGCSLEKALQAGQIVLSMDASGFFFQYGDHKLPLEIKSYHLILSQRPNTLIEALGHEHTEYLKIRNIIDRLEQLPSLPNSKRKITNHYHAGQAIKREVLNLLKSSATVKAFAQENIDYINGGQGKGIKLLEQLLQPQNYLLTFWEMGHEVLNYRRFFDINELIGIRMENPEVFAATHELILRLIHEGKVNGLRIDHIDGLHDPLAYLRRIQKSVLSPSIESSERLNLYVVVEKILSGEESMLQEWPVSGTTGYDFINMLNALFVDSEGIQKVGEIYTGIIGQSVPFNDVVYQKKRQVIAELFPGEIRALSNQLAQIATRNITLKDLTTALTEVTSCLPVYRSYIRSWKISQQDHTCLEYAWREVKRRNPTLAGNAVDFLRRLLLLEIPDYLTDEQKEERHNFVLNWQQLTGAVMAKGFEDTALYNYNRLISLNEVGGNPNSDGLSLPEFHRRNANRYEQWPHTLNATSTHDTKRSEDVRARINVLSELIGEWKYHLGRWQEWNQRKKLKARGMPVPEPNMEIFLYQTLLGAWPLDGRKITEFKNRLKAYLIKAARESKRYSNWLKPDIQYEDALLKFTESTLETSPQNEFLHDFIQFSEKIAYYGAINSLAQVLLKITLPGVPDFYQGTELWVFSLVDPDNRRPVDFDKRITLLDEMIQQEKGSGQLTLIRKLLKSWKDGRVKMYLTYKALNLRRANTKLFQDGTYLPLNVSGKNKDCVCAFARGRENNWIMVVVPRFTTRLVGQNMFPVGPQVWENDSIIIPDAPRNWRNVFTGENIVATGNELALAEVLNYFPVALLINK